MEPEKSHFRFYAATRQRLGISASSVHKELQEAWGDSSPTEHTIYHWFQGVNEGEEESFTDKPHSGRPTSMRTLELISNMENLIKDDPHLSSRDVAEQLVVDQTTALHILRDDLNL